MALQRTPDYRIDRDLFSFVWVEPSDFTTQLLEAAVFVLAHMDQSMSVCGGKWASCRECALVPAFIFEYLCVN